VILASSDDVGQQVEAWRERGQRVGVLAPHRPDGLPDDVTWLQLAGSAREQAHALYRRLREADHVGLQVLVTVMPPDLEVGQALCDRLRRAAGLGDGADPTVQPVQRSTSDA
jgi:L-threonylcarbamoyladenylate synthase